MSKGLVKNATYLVVWGGHPERLCRITTASTPQEALLCASKDTWGTVLVFEVGDVFATETTVVKL